MKFKKGDKVRVKKFKERPSYWNTYGEMDYLNGKVVEVKKASDTGIWVDGNGLGGYLALKNEDVEPVKNECIVIYRKENQVIALDKVTGEKAIAKCSPEDEFDFYTGAKLAFERLTGTPEIKYPRPLNTKICVIETLFDQFTKGKIYEIHDGKITDNLGNVWPVKKIFHSMDDVKEYFAPESSRKTDYGPHFDLRGVKFIEVVE